MWIKGLDAIGPGGHQEICRPGKGGEKGSGSENGGRYNNRCDVCAHRFTKRS